MYFLQAQVPLPTFLASEEQKLSFVCDTAYYTQILMSTAVQCCYSWLIWFKVLLILNLIQIMTSCVYCSYFFCFVFFKTEKYIKLKSCILMIYQHGTWYFENVLRSRSNCRWINMLFQQEVEYVCFHNPYFKINKLNVRHLKHLFHLFVLGGSNNLKKGSTGSHQLKLKLM